MNSLINKMSDKIDYNKDTWEVVKIFLEQYKNKELIRHHIDTFNDFMENKIPSIVKQFNPLVVYHEYIPETNSYKYEIHIEYGDIYYSSPTIHENDGSSKPMYPQEARLRNLTYAVNIFMDINIKVISNGEEPDIFVKNLKNVKIGKIPIMLRSKFCLLNSRHNLNNNNHDECKYDLGGYFLINGNEKVIVSQEKIAENKVYVFKNSKTSSKFSHVAEIKSVSEDKFITPKNISIKLTSKEGSIGRTIKVIAPHIKLEIPLFIMFRALGIESDKEIMKYIVNGLEHHDILKLLKPSVEDSYSKITTDDAYEYLLKGISILGQPRDIKLDRDRKIEYLKNMLLKDFLPHVGPDLKNKALFLGYMTNRLLKCYLKQVDYDDRDSYENKRIETPGVLMSILFRQYFTKLVKDMRNSIMKELNSGPWKTTKNIEEIVNATNLYKIFKSTTIESGLKYGLATGNWGIKSTTAKVGIAQVLSRLSYNSTLSHLRRVNTPTEKTGKLIPPRKLHNSQWGIICPTETPEGGSVGLVKNLAISTHVTNYSNSLPIKEYCLDLGLEILEKCSFEDIHKFTKIFVNGNWLGIHKNPMEILQELRNYRRVGKINPYVSITFQYNLNEIRIFTDARRCCRPLYIVDDNNLRITKTHIEKIKKKELYWNKLIVDTLNPKEKYSNNLGIPKIRQGVIEYIDSEESKNIMVSMNDSYLKEKNTANLLYTHCEIHPSLILGIIASTIPFPHHNQSPRNTYQSAMGKQAMGIYATNYRQRMDTMAHILYYCNEPLVNTKIGTFLPTNKVPNGMNVVVAIATYTGYNQEDSIIMNRSSVQRGLFRSTFYRTYKDDEKKIQSSGHEERFVKPDKSFTKNMKPGSYEKLKNDGLVKENTFVDHSDIIIGKVIPVKNTKINGNQVYRDNSTSLRNNESGFIDKVYVNRNGEGHRFCKVRVRSDRIPTIGDKFSSRHGQKGTMGMIYDQADMPFTKDGISPDLIINPHAIPSRMTIAQLLECILGKAGTLIGGFGDGTPFVNNDDTKLTVNSVGDILEKTCGFQRHGDEILYNGQTGEQMKTQIFIGPTFYQRLKHMVDDKIHSRASGPMVLLTRQPAEGRVRDGGLRFGEMERDCMIAHGSLQFLKERMLDVSDNFRLFICNICGMTAKVNPDKDVYICSRCNNYTNFSETRIPYACKLLIQELESMFIASRIKVKY